MCLASQACQTKVHGGPMTVVAGIVALLLLGYLVVALLKPERF
jgi:K+-transporting ATPase KdpF subunit